jgi:hypothetical protein
MRTSLRTAVPLAACVLLSAAAARAQERPTDVQFGQPPAGRGWLFTPSLGVSSVVDDNVLMQGNGDNTQTDLVSVLSPHASLAYSTTRNVFAANYDGAFELYRQLDSLNNYGQFETLSARHRSTARTSFYLQQQLSVTPTTELPLVIGVPFIRMGAKVADAKGGIEHAFTKRTSADVSYDFQWIAFDKDPVLGRVLFGGRGHTGTAAVRHQLTASTSLIADYQVQHAIITNGDGTFTVQTARAGGERKVTNTFTVVAEAGFARVSQSTFESGRTSPSWRVGASKQFQRFAVDGSYDRTFIPAFGVGDTVETQDVGAHVKAAVTRRVYAEGGMDWRHDHPLSQTAAQLLGEAPLRSFWFTGTVGYTASPWLRIEGFVAMSRQQINRPGGQMDRDRVGIQVTTTKPMRVR